MQNKIILIAILFKNPTYEKTKEEIKTRNKVILITWVFKNYRIKTLLVNKRGLSISENLI